MVNVNVNVKVNTNVKCFVDKYSEITSTWLDLKQNQYEKLNCFLSKGRERERERAPHKLAYWQRNRSKNI